MSTTDDLKIHIVENYYRSLLNKDFETMADYLHDDVHFIGPLAEMRGKNSVITAAQGLSTMIHNITIRSKFGACSQVMLAYDMEFTGPIGLLRAAVLMDLVDHKITRIELFYDSAPFVSVKDTIFTKNNNSNNKL